MPNYIKLLISTVIVALATPVYYWLWVQDLNAPLIIFWLAVVFILFAVWKRKKITFNLEPEIDEEFLCEGKKLKCVKAISCMWCFFLKHGSCNAPIGIKCIHNERKDSQNVKFIIV